MIFALMIIGSAVMLLDDRQFARAEPISTRLKSLPLLALTLFTVLTLAVMASTIALCGAGLCPDSPERYLLFQ
jgi:hypothetical protein